VVTPHARGRFLAVADRRHRHGDGVRAQITVDP
jgi:hypothetical protein